MVRARPREQLKEELTAIGRRFYERGWVHGTSGNFSAVVQRKPMRLAITPSSAHKGKSWRPSHWEI